MEYTLEDRIIAFTLYRGKLLKEGIGLFSMARIAELTGHSISSLEMKSQQFSGVAGGRKKSFVLDSAKPGLSQWADQDELVWKMYKEADLPELIEASKKYLKYLWKNK